MSKLNHHPHGKTITSKRLYRVKIKYCQEVKMNQNTKALLVASASSNKNVASKMKAYLNSRSNATKATNNYKSALNKIRMVNGIPTMTAIAVLYILNYLTGLAGKNTNNGRNAKKLLNSLGRSYKVERNIKSGANLGNYMA
jgi:hypothetical protein